MASTISNAAQGAGNGKPPRENLYRINPDIGLTRAADGAMPTMTGHFAVWNQWTEIRSAYEGHFMERFAPGAMTKTLSENAPKVLFQHGKDPQIGDKVLGPIQRVEPDQTGAFYEVQLLDTSYNRDLIPGLDAGLYGASFRFSVLQEDVVQRPKRSESNPHGLPERTVTEARVMEFGPVTFPAYAGASAGIRSITDDVLRWQLGIDPEELEERAKKAVKHTHTYRVSFNAADRADPAAQTILAEMHDLGVQFIGLEADPEDADDRDAMNTILAQIDALNKEESQEPDNDGTGNSSDDTPRATEPEPSEATTLEPEPSAATTRSASTNLFWFVDTPAHLRS